MIRKVTSLMMLLVMLCCSITLSVTYSKYLLSKSIDGEITTRTNCIDMGITSLSECMLVMDTTTNNVESAKLYIASKGEADIIAIAPTIKYVEKQVAVENSNGIISSTMSYTFASSYTFNSETGVFTLIDAIHTNFSDDYIGWYTCGGNLVIQSTCTTIYKVEEYVIEQTSTGINQKLTKGIKHTYFALDSFDSEIGLYQSEDDYGTSYFYRGNVKNNYVSYAGFIWRIVRQNGDGSIRMIYAGTSTSSSGTETSIGTSKYNNKTWDPTYVGYMYSEDFTENIGTTAVNYALNSNAIYYYGNSYIFDENTNKYKLSGDMISGTWQDNYEEVIANYPYTCRSSSSETATCLFVVHAKSYKNDTTINANLITYSSKSYESAIKNVTDSVLKQTVETWYENNILNLKDSDNNLYSDYLSDEIFCNDRTFYSGTGYAASAYTAYSAHKRIYVEKNPSFMCTQDNDKFTYVSSNGNGMLKYPIGLLTVDEAFYAGSPSYAVNSNNFLNVGANYWTMTPAQYDSAWAVNRLWYVDLTGGVYATYVGHLYGVRPVINLRSDIKITSGDGTAESPYIVSV